jgi:tRNA (mo5U34)-methyltransferase
MANSVLHPGTFSDSSQPKGADSNFEPKDSPATLLEPEAQEELSRQIADLGQWFHNINLHGVWTAPDHFLGDFPNLKWKHIADQLPQDLAGATVLDIGCNAGFYSLEMKRRGAARVLGIDVDERYLNQARFAARTLRLEIEFERRSVYDLNAISGQFDYVFFMGVLYHLRYPLYALDNVVKKMRGQLIFQTMLRGSEQSREWQKDYHFWNNQIFSDPDFPCMYFIENKYAGDYTNWWIPNRGAAEGMLRSAGLEIISHPESEIWICAAGNLHRDGQYVIDRELAGAL